MVKKQYNTINSSFLRGLAAEGTKGNAVFSLLSVVMHNDTGLPLFTGVVNEVK